MPHTNRKPSVSSTTSRLYCLLHPVDRSCTKECSDNSTPGVTNFGAERSRDPRKPFVSAGGSLDNIAIGTDMDGGFGAEVTPTDVDTIADLQGFPSVLHEAGFSDRDINGVLHGNALRFFRQAWTH